MRGVYLRTGDTDRGGRVRIALVAEDYYPQLGGVPEHVHNLALQLIAWGHRVTIVTSHMRGDHRDDAFVRRVGTSLVVYANGGVSRVTVGRQLRRRLESLFRDRFDVVHVHGGLAPTFGMVAPLAARRLGIPVVATFHSWFRRSPGCYFLRTPLQQLLDLHAAVIAVSEPVVQAMSRYFTADWEIIPNGVDRTYFHPVGRRLFGCDGEGPRLLFLHRLEPRNHLETLLAAMPGVLREYPTAQLVVAGDGAWRPYYEARAVGLEASVRFLGRIDDRPVQYRAADLYLCPTTRGSFGISLLEAMACGTPMIVADSPGFRALVAGGAEAKLLPHDDPDAWAEWIVALMKDPARRQRMSEAGVAKSARYGWPEVAGQVLKVYERVVRGARLGRERKMAVATPFASVAP
jgi:phosphatidylinositol alpha-mannosyltransferase